MERIKIQNKKPIVYQRTLSGLKELVTKAENYDIPENAQIDWREWNVAEFLWSAVDEL
jgi:hypothetical protein